MNKREENKFTMYQGIKDLLAENQSSVATIPAFEESFQIFQDLLSRIAEKDQQYQNISVGAAEKKNQAEDELIDTLIAASSALRVFARRQKDEDLRKSSKVTATSLKRLRDSELLTKSQNTFEAISQRQSSLKRFGMTEEFVNDFKTKLDNFNSALGSKESRVAESKSARQELGEDFDMTDEVLYEELDGMIELVKKADPEFYNKYQAGRTIKDI
jgi:hypothetical protein